MKGLIFISLGLFALMIPTFNSFASETKQEEQDRLQLKTDNDIQLYLIGLWSLKRETFFKKYFAEQEFKADGTFRGSYSVEQKIPFIKNIVMNGSFKGVWHIEDGICMETVLESNPELNMTQKTSKYRLLNVYQNHHVTENIGDGSKAKYFRVNQKME